MYAKKDLKIDDYMLDKVLDKIKMVSIEKIDDAKILIDTGDELPHYITFKMLWCYYMRY